VHRTQSAAHSFLQSNQRFEQKWWRRRESNPRPRHFHVEAYILSLSTNLLLPYQETGVQEIAFSNDRSNPKAGIDRFQPYMTPVPRLGWPSGAAQLHYYAARAYPFSGCFFFPVGFTRSPEPSVCPQSLQLPRRNRSPPISIIDFITNLSILISAQQAHNATSILLTD